MSTEPSEPLRTFLREHVSSYEKLEALLLLASHGERAWTDAEVAASLNTGVDSISSALQDLGSVDGLLSVQQRAGLAHYQYAPQTAQLRQLVEELARLQVEQRLTLVQIMSANALERVRSAAMRRLADAFKLERPKK